MESPLVWTHPQRYVSGEAETDFIAAITQCEKLAGDAMESEHQPTQYQLYQQLHDYLTAIHPTLLDPIPEALEEQFTTRTFPESMPTMDTESDLLCEYCLTLSELLSGHALDVRGEETLQGLLYELTCFLADTMRAPRWLKTPQGRVPL